MIEKMGRFFRDGLWDFPLSQVKGWRHFGFKCLRIAYLSVRGFFADHCTLHASSLTYYTLMSIVPLLAMSLAIAKGFGYQENLRTELLNRFDEHRAILLEIFPFAEKVLEEAKGGVIAGIGLLILFWSVTQLLSSLESTLNHIWGVKKMRSWRRITIDYFALMLIAPIFFLFASSMAVFVVGKLEIAVRALPIGTWGVGSLLFLVHLLPYCLFWILFSFVYLFMPNTKVHFNSALIGGFFAGCLYVIVQWGYIYFQVGVSRYGAIYGSMAALPLFLIWVQVSWFLFLFGAEISCAHQTLDAHEFEGKVSKISYGFKRLLSLWITHLAIRRFSSRERPLTLEILIKQHQLPVALAVPILQELVDCHLLVEVKGGYIPARPLEELRISDVIEAMETRGTRDFPFIDSKALAPFEKALDQFRAQIESSPENRLLKHVSNSI